MRGSVIEKRFWTTEQGTQGYYTICRGSYTGDKAKDDVVLLPLGVIESISSL